MKNILEYESFNFSDRINEGLKIEKTASGNISINGKEYQLEAEFNPNNYLNPFGKTWNRVKVEGLSQGGSGIKVKIKKPTEMENSIDPSIVTKIEKAISQGKQVIDIPGIVPKRLKKV
jgi:hypothetical protein